MYFLLSNSLTPQYSHCAIICIGPDSASATELKERTTPSIRGKQSRKFASKTHLNKPSNFRRHNPPSGHGRPVRQEKLSKYRPGGYHPVSLGDTFKDDRYQIHHKLGWGGFSTVWLAYDKEKNQWVSVKIMRAHTSQGSRGLYNLQLLADRSQGKPSAKYIVSVFDSFTHQGPNGTHLCIVFELLGPSVNISGGNIAFSCTNFSHASKEELFAVIGSPEVEELARLDGKPLDNSLPKQLVKSAEWETWVDEDEEDIRILDFGEAFLRGNEPKVLAQPGQLRVPELIFTDCFDYRVDLWRAGCMIHAFMFGSYPFQYLGEDEVLVSQMIRFVGKLPKDWRPIWERMKMNFKRGLKESEVIRQLMRFVPSSRIKASEALALLRSEQDADYDT
ncbi:kinase-like protein [Aspergillus eucalypticola CBS 122712]|uniref:non-specific serine/threonine protein kinase n=1 Tax=Aspergillus eucalypticola (strain CBS 122712 / IBT 29274) TaxID=1448314 RepID=A0A317W2H3_ASPEC|nr:kinase-like protein [Aspergillus eucalypticola CBS 122712]PWY80089.1 kinase-like protein [Aspergillus eucalypticola CBS 122712]